MTEARRVPTEAVDVVVVGGGPAGSTAAALIARQGHRVVALERQHHPRHQIGESLLPSTIHGVCRLLGVSDELHAAGFMRKRGGTFRWGARPEPWTFAFSIASPEGADYAFQVERARFDQILFEHARRCGVDAREGVEVTSALLDNGEVTGVRTRDEQGREAEIHAPWTIDASGNASRLARHAGERIHSDFFRNVAVYGYYRGAGRQPPPNQGNIITSAFADGWCWFIPLSDELTSVGAVIDRRHAGRLQGDRERALREFVAACPIIGDKLAGAQRIADGMYGEIRVRKDWSYSHASYSAPGLLLAGDAACFIDPVFSSGVHLATYAGLLAARTLNTMLAGDLDPTRCLREFERRYRDEFRLFYEFLVAFYDMRQEWDSYYWTARELLATPERANEAFVRLIAGGASAPEDFFSQRAGAGAAFADVLAVAAETAGPEQVEPGAGPMTGRRRVRGQVSAGLARMHGADPEDAAVGGSLVPSPDGLRWREAHQLPTGTRA
ncbi:MAG: tryptophan 7-halogenase [Solirubrobacteraceae bacterium]